ncbi:hypothetical protein DRN87_02070, partial [Candidatus Geothermarchaeota archaeon]
MLTKESLVNDFIRLGKKYRDTYIEVFEDEDGYTVIIYCDVKPNDEVKLFKEFDRLIVCIGMEKVEYENEEILTNDEVEGLRETYRKMGRYRDAKRVTNRIIGKIDWPQYKYIFRIPIESEFKVKNYKIDRDALIIKL